MITIKLCLFASLSETLNTREEYITLATGSTLSELKNTLIARGDAWQALADHSILCAINHEMVNHQNATLNKTALKGCEFESSASKSTVLHNNDEVAFFPPVTGG